MRPLILSLTAALVLAPAVSAAQEGKPITTFKGLVGADLYNYCIWSDSIYSVGAFICSSQTTELQCARPQPDKVASWIKTDSKQCLSPR